MITGSLFPAILVSWNSGCNPLGREVSVFSEASKWLLPSLTCGYIFLNVAIKSLETLIVLQFMHCIGVCHTKLILGPQAPQSVRNLKIKEINTWFILLLVCLYSLIEVSGWIRVILSNCLPVRKNRKIYLQEGDIREQEIAQNNLDPPRNHTQWIKTHKDQDKSSISFIFKFPTDWGACVLDLASCFILSHLGGRFSPMYSPP